MKKVLIIAEAGVNHNGDMDLAKQLIDAAADAGADIVKFQTFKAKNLVSKSAVKADYQITNTKDDGSQFDMLKKLELKPDIHEDLRKYCASRNIEFLSTPFDSESLDFLMDFGMQTVKIPSGEITNRPFLEDIARYNKRVILSTGMSDLSEIEDAVNILVGGGTDRHNISILHCNTEYPTPFEDVNLKAMDTIRQKLNLPVGYSDHTLGIEVPVAAVAMGASIIEKHFTMDRTLDGPDHLASLEPDDLKKMVESIRNIENALGNGIKSPSASERKNIAIARKSIHFSSNLEEGHVLREEDLVMKRPGDGINPMRFRDYLGKKLTRSVVEDSQLKESDII